MFRPILVLTMIMLVLGSASAMADTRYVRDVVIINLRVAPSNGAETIELLRTGDSVEVLSEQGDFLRVRSESGKEGFVSKQYMTPDEPALRKLRRADARVESLSAQVDALKAKLSESDGETERLRSVLKKQSSDSDQSLNEQVKEVASLTGELKELKAKYADLKSKSSNVVEISDERDRLAVENEDMKARLGQQSESIESMTKMSALKWFLVGAGVLLAGWVLGALTGRKKKNRGYH